jgi:hypothetical protein
MRTVLVLAFSLSALAGCGLRGDLVRPMPLWGDPPLDGADDPRVIAAAKKAAEEAEAAAEAEENAAEDPAAPAPTTPPQ